MDDLVIVMWINEPSDLSKPDIFFDTVWKKSEKSVV